MSLLSKVGAFDTGTAAAGNNVVITGVGFQPKLVLFWYVAVTGSTDQFAGARLGQGFGAAASSTSRWSVAVQSENAVTTTNTDRAHREDACIVGLASDGTESGVMDFVSMDSDGFTLIIDVQYVGDRRVQYLALGGTDVTDVKLGRFDEPAVTGDQDITAVGFQPDMVMFGGIGSGTDPPLVTTTNALILGAASGASEQACFFGIDNNAAADSANGAYCRSGECIVSGSATTITKRASLSAFLSNGFRLNWIERTGDMVIFYVAVKGGNYHVGDVLLSTTLGATIVETGLGFAPKGAFMLSAGKVESTADVQTANYQLNMGGFSSLTDRNVSGNFSEDAQAISDIEVFIEHDQVMAQITATPSLVGLTDVQSIDSDGFTLVMDSAASTAAFVWYVSFGDAAAATEDPYPYVGGGYYPTQG